MSNTGDAPSLTKHKNFRKVAVILIAILLIFVFVSRYKDKEEKYKAEESKRQVQAQIELQNRTQKFTLPPCTEDGECEEVPTVDAGPGTKHRLRGDVPYRAISNQPDGKRIIYPMPAGWETWTGTAPAGKLRLANAKGAKEKTLVEVIRVR